MKTDLSTSNGVYTNGHKIEMVLEPSNIDAEEGLLGAIMIFPEQMTNIVPLILPSDFYDEQNRIIYTAMLALYERGEKIDNLTMFDQLEAVGRNDLMPLLTRYQSLDIRSQSAEAYARIISKKSMQRKLIHASGEIAKLAYKPTTDEPETIYNRAEQVLQNILTEFPKQSGPVHVGQVMNEVLDEVEMAYHSNEPIGISTSLKELDKLLDGGFKKSELIILAGRPSMGKTALAAQMGIHAAKSNLNVLIFSLEMSNKAIGRRILGTQSGITASRIVQASIQESEWSNIIQSANQMSKLPLYIDDSPALSSKDIRNRALRFDMKYGVDLIIVDHLTEMGWCNPAGVGTNMHHEVKERVSDMKNLAKTLDVPLVLLSQLNRSVEGRQDKRPRLSDLRESGSIEEVLDVGLFLYRDDYYHPDTEFPNVCEIILAKNRGGRTGVAMAYFKKELTQFIDLQVRVQRLDVDSMTAPSQSWVNGEN